MPTPNGGLGAAPRRLDQVGWRHARIAAHWWRAPGAPRPHPPALGGRLAGNLGRMLGGGLGEAPAATASEFSWPAILLVGEWASAQAPRVWRLGLGGEGSWEQIEAVM